MRVIRIFAFLAAAALLLTACKKEDQQASPAVAQNPLLAYVPVDTPYLFANLEPTPPEVVDAFLARFAPTLDLAQTLLDDLRIEVSPGDSDDNRHARLIAAIMAEMDGKLNREGIESLGFSLESHKAIYGMGAFPVMRFALGDSAALRAAIGRIEAASGMAFPAEIEGGVEYWRFTDEHEQAALYVAILADHVAIGMFPAAVQAQMLPALLGQEKARNPGDPGAALAQLNREKGFTGFGSGYLDLQKIATEFLDGNSTTMRSLGTLSDYDPVTLDPACTAEIRGMIAHAPRMVMGTTELTADAVAVKYQLELDETLAGQLANLVADVPVAGDDPNRMFAASLGIRAGRLRELLLDKATAMSASPFKCEKLADLNQAASDALEQMNRPMPPFIGNLNGFRVSIDEIDLENPSPENTRGTFALEIEKPQMVVGMAQMFVPGIDELGLEPGAEPVELPQELMSMATGEMHVYAAMSKDSIGLAMGAEQKDGLADFMAETGANDGTFFSVSYDMAAHLEFQNRMREQFMGAYDAGAHHDGEIDQVQDMIETLQESYKDMLGRARLDMRFTPSGLEIENRMTFR